MRLAHAFLVVLPFVVATAHAESARRPAYVQADGSVLIVGDRALEPVLARVNAIYEREHPGTRFTMVLRGKPVGIDGIVAGVALFAPVAHDAWEGEIEPFKRLTGHAPLDVRIGRFGYAAPGRERPPAVYVNAANPLERLGMDELARIFTTGAMPSDLRRWGQLGLGGDWTQHAIHIYGTRDDGQDATQLRLDRLGGHPFAAHYEPLATARDVIDAVAHDRYGIGLVGIPHAGADEANTRPVALARTPEGAASLGTLDDVRQGLYPLSSWLHAYVDVAPGRAMDPVAAEYLSILLSDEGQAIIAAAAGAGLVPLAPSEVGHERAKLFEPRAQRNVERPDERRIP